MKVLFVATVRSHIGQFHMPFIRCLKDAGWTVEAAFKDNSVDKPGLDLSGIDRVYEIPFERNPLKFKNVQAYFELKKVIDKGEYEIIHCHTPMGAFIARLAAVKARKNGTKVIYTAHGFHFYKGAPLINWIMFYPVEKFLAKFTDLLITINDEDYNLARRKRFKAGEIVKVNGVGVDLTQFKVCKSQEKEKLRFSYGFKQKQYIMLYAADLSERKNQQMLLKALALIKDKTKDMLLLLPGQPIMREAYENMAVELGIQDKVKFLGYRRDIDKLLACCDCVISSSRQEGLPINLIEAAGRGKYIIATRVRGNADVVRQSGYGKLVPLNDYKKMAIEILFAYEKRFPVKELSDKINVYSIDSVNREMIKLYNVVLNGE